MKPLRVPFLDLKRQHAEVAERVNPQVIEILETGAYVMGKYNRELEAALAAKHQVKHAIAVNSGTDALRIMMQACDIGPGDEVITTAFTFVASIEVIIQLGAIPVLVDVREHDFMIDPACIEAAITPKTKAIMPIHLFGQLADMAAIQAIAERHGLIVLEDAAQAVCSTQGALPAGNFGSAAGLSFYVTKNLGAAGDGGMILTNSDEVAERSRSLRIHGMGKERYYYDSVGYTSRMAEIQACVLFAKLDRLDDWHAARGRIAERLIAGLSGLPGIHPPSINPGNNHTWHQFTIRAEGRDALQAHLKGLEIDAMIYYPVPLHFHTPYEHLAKRGALPITERISDEVLSLPVHQYLTDAEVDAVIEGVKSFATVRA